MIETLPITVCLPVRNEEKNLPECLKSLGTDFPQMVVVDSSSTDRTAEIARAAGALVLDFRWDGRFPKKRNWALRAGVFTQPWVLFLDADERMTQDVVDELRRILPTTEHDGFWIEYTNWFMGTPLRYGDTMCKLALFRVGAGEYERFPEDSWSDLDMEVHEHPILSGTVGRLASRLEHHDHRGLQAYLARHNEYSTWETRRFLWLAKAGPTAWTTLNNRQKFKYRHLNAWWLAWLYWFAALILKRGFLDGVAGWRLAALKRRYFHEIRLKILEKDVLTTKVTKHTKKC